MELNELKELALSIQADLFIPDRSDDDLETVIIDKIYTGYFVDLPSLIEDRVRDAYPDASEEEVEEAVDYILQEIVSSDDRIIEEPVQYLDANGRKRFRKAYFIILEENDLDDDYFEMFEEGEY